MTSKFIGEAPEKKTYIGLVLDKSGSMAAIKDQIIDAFNEQLNVIKINADKGGTTRVTFVQFGASENPVEVLFDNAVVDELIPLSSSNYVPEAFTPMYDGVGRCISMLEAHDDKGEDTAFLVIVLSDGMENSSREFTSGQIAETIKRLQDTERWSFVYLGCNQDLADVQKHLGLVAGNMLDWNNSVDVAASTMTTGTAVYLNSRMGGMTSTRSYVEDSETKE